MTVVLVLSVLWLCVVACLPVYFASRWAGQWFNRHVLKPRFQRDMAALGIPQEQIDSDWDTIERGEWPDAG